MHLHSAVNHILRSAFVFDVTKQLRNDLMSSIQGTAIYRLGIKCVSGREPSSPGDLGQEGALQNQKAAGKEAGLAGGQQALFSGAR